MSKLPVLILFTFFSNLAISQSTVIKFKKERDTVRRSTSEKIVRISMVIDSNTIADSDKASYLITAVIDQQKTTLPTSDYSLDFSSISYEKVSGEYSFYLRLKPDDNTDRDRFVYINIELTQGGNKSTANNAANGLTYILLVQGSLALSSYNYLAYVGTNFDLVDGVQAKNLFFATNIFAAPIKDKGFGFNLTLYGNRTTTSTDTTGRLNYIARAIPIGGDSARFYRENALRTVERVSDNLGASFSPIIRLTDRLSDVDNVVQLYYSPQLELIWRRTTITTRYTDIQLVDSMDRANRPFSGPIMLMEPMSTVPINVYDIYLGVAGVLLAHENKFVSVRLQAAIGLNISYTSGRGSALTRENTLSVLYDRNAQAYFFTRAWITEPVSGITIGAEVSNTLFRKERSQPYYNVTLSKAINLNALGTLFAPVTAR